MTIRVVVICMLLLPISAAASAESADPNNWHWWIVATALPQGLGSATLGGVGVASGATDGYDSLGSDWPLVPGTVPYCGTYHVNDPDGWTGQTGFYSNDTRAPLLLQPGISKNWEIYVWADPSLPATASMIEVDWSNGHPLPSNLSFTLTFKSQPASVTGGPALGTVWNLSEHSGGEVFLPVFRTTDGREGYVFDFTATVIPEPSSLLALLAGLGGFGLVLRRRRA